MDHAGFRRGAAHVEGDGVLQSQAAAKRLRADDARRRSRLKHAHALLLRLLRLVKAAGRLHEEEFAGERRVVQVSVDLGDVVTHPRPDVRVRRHGRAALELAIFLRELVRRRDEGVRQALTYDGLDARFVSSVHITVEKKDCHCLDAALDHAIARRMHRALIKRHEHFALGAHALAHF